MNFNQWIKKYNKYNPGDRYSYRDIMSAWEACKQEALKILKTKENFIGTGIKSAIKEVERL